MSNQNSYPPRNSSNGSSHYTSTRPDDTSSYRDSGSRARIRDTRGPDPRARREFNDLREHRFKNDGTRPNDRRPYRYNEREDRRDRPTSNMPSVDPDAKLSKEDIIKKYEQRLIGLLKIPTINKFPVIDSQWGIKPKGFENVTAQRAKLSGLFPLPGSPRPVDVTKLDGLLQDGCTEDGILLASSKIDPLDSRNSCIAIIEDVDFSRVDHLLVSEYINKYISAADIKGVSLGNNIERKRKTKDDKKLIIEFKTSVAATFALTLDGETIPANILQTESDISFKVSRPGEYVVQCLPPYSSPKGDVDEEVLDSPRKLTLLIDKDTNESSLVNELDKIAPLRAFQFVREVGTKQGLGIAFVEFFIDSKQFPGTKNALKQIMSYLDQTRRLAEVRKASFSCLKVSSDNVVETSIQDCPIELKTLKGLVRNEYVAFHPKSKVVQIINAVTATDLMDDSSFKFIEQDIFQEANTFGKVISIKIPRPPHDYSPGISHLTQPGIGKIFIEFESENTALKALMNMAGRSYNDRTVLCAFYSHKDYANGLF